MLRKVKYLLLILVLLLTLLPQAAFAAASGSAPYDLQAKLIDPDETHPHGSVLLTFKLDNLPRSDATKYWYVYIEKKVGAGGPWYKADEVSSDEFLDYYQTSAGVFQFEQLWVEDYAWDGSTPVSFRVKVVLYDETFSFAGESAWSDTASVGVQGSSWALTELQKASEYGLIPDILDGKDLTKPITREEFCELALLLYEKTTDKTPSPVSPNPFTDTANTQILKAFALGITTGTSSTTFSPNELITREQCAAMLFRAIKAINPGGNYSIAGVPDFPDQKHISAYAVEAAKYMSRLEIIKGDAQGYFMPKATTTAQQAAGYGMATREAAILMTVRTYDVMPEDLSSSLSAGGQQTAGSGVGGADGAGSGKMADFSGEWAVMDETSGEVMCVMSLTQSGSTVSGTFTDSNQNSAGMSGTVTGMVLTAVIDHPFFGGGWKWILTLDDDNDSVTGVWTDGAEQTYPVTGSRE